MKEDNCMEYINKVLGLKVNYLNNDFNHYPNFINTRYHLRKVALDKQKMIFLYPKVEIESIQALRKHIERIQKEENIPIVLILDNLPYRQKEYLIRDRIPFVVEGKQIYLPFMAMYLQERCNAEKQTYEELLPSAQLLFLYFIYNGAKDLTTSQAAKDLELTPTSLSRASKQLEELQLLQTKKVGVQKILYSSDTPKTLFQNSKNKLVNPVKRKVFIPKENLDVDLVASGYSALSEYSMLNEPATKSFATNNCSKWKSICTDYLYDSEHQIELQLWRYDPRKLACNNIVDILSLALSLEDDFDERVEESIEESLENLWREIDGNRN